MLVFDPTLDTFRFAHLSVREFLEKRPEYTKATINALAAETTLLDVLSAADSLETRQFLSTYRHGLSDSARSHELRPYSTVYWASHCQLAANKREGGVLKDLLLHFPSNGSDPRSAIVAWAAQIENCFDDYSIRSELRDRLRSTKADEGRTLFIASCFDLREIASVRANFRNDIKNMQGMRVLEVAAVYGSCNVISILIEDENTQITEEILEAAAGNEGSGKDIIMLLLDQREAEVVITEGVLKAAASNKSGKDIIMLLLGQRGAEVVITEGVLKAAAGNEGSGKEIMMLLLDQRGAEVVITEEVLKVVVGNWGSGKEVMILLLDQRGAEVVITEEVLKAAAGNRGVGKT